jgi:hypothetical protein
MPLKINILMSKGIEVVLLSVVQLNVADPWDQCYKVFYVCNSQIFVKSLSVCPWQASPA